MEYYNDGEIIIRDLEERDIAGIVEGEPSRLFARWKMVEPRSTTQSISAIAKPVESRSGSRGPICRKCSLRGRYSR